MILCPGFWVLSPLLHYRFLSWIANFMLTFLQSLCYKIYSQFYLNVPVQGERYTEWKLTCLWPPFENFLQKTNIGKNLDSFICLTLWSGNCYCSVLEKKLSIFPIFPKPSCRYFQGKEGPSGIHNKCMALEWQHYDKFPGTLSRFCPESTKLLLSLQPLHWYRGYTSHFAIRSPHIRWCGKRGGC